MDINHNANGTATVSMPAQWTVKNANDDKKQLNDFITHDSPNLILDFSNTQFIDSTGLGTLVAILKACKQQQGDLVLCCLSPKVQAIIELTQLQKIFTIFSSLEQAEASLNG